MTNHLTNIFKEQVVIYTNAHLDKALNESLITTEDVFVVWSCKTLQNFKALLGTTRMDGMYYECTYNGDKEEIYLDVYKKCENKCIKNVENYYTKSKAPTKPKFKLEDYSDNARLFIMHCDTPEKAEFFLSYLEKNDPNWRGDLCNSKDTKWEACKEHTGYYFNEGDYGYISPLWKEDEYENWHHVVLEFDNFEWK